MDYLFLVMLIASTYASASYLRTKALTVVAFIVIFAFWFVCNMFTGNGVTDAVYYHLKSNAHGTSIDDILPKIYVALGFVFLCIIIVTSSFKLHNKIPVRKPWVLNTVFILLCALNVSQSKSYRNVYNSLSNFTYENGFKVAGNYKNIEYHTDKNYNYVFIYAESLERTLRNINGVNYIPHISKISDDYLDFTNIEQIPGAGWTMAGMVNTQCAVPLVLPQGNTASNMSHFLAGADCIATHLQKAGYTTEFVRGSDKEFAGGDKFFSQHGWQSQHDKNYFLKNNIVTENEISGWGVHDDKLLDHVYNEFERLSSERKKFLLSFLTVNTHPPAGTYLSACDGFIPDNIDNPMLKSVSCSDYLLGKFINKIINSKYFDNTIVVLVSDHLMMANAASEKLDDIQDKRRNNFIIIKKGLKTQRINKPGTLLDVWPTLLDISAAKNTDFGFGHSLISDAKSDILNAWITSKNIGDYLGFASSLWSYPSLNEPMNFKSNILTIGQQQYHIPLFGVADENKNIKSIYFEAFALNAKKLIEEGDILFYINECSMTSTNKKGICAYELSRKDTTQYEINDSGVINRKVIDKTSPLYAKDFISVSSGPLNLQTGISDGMLSLEIPRGINFYSIHNGGTNVNQELGFDTCNNQQIDMNIVKKHLNDEYSHLIFTSNDSAFCIPYEVRPSINKLLRSDSASFLASRQQVIGVYDKNKTRFIIGVPEKPLDIFISKDNFQIYQLCNIFSEC